MSDDNSNSFRDKLNMLMDFILKVGFPTVVSIYFLVRDYLFQQELIKLQTQIAIVMAQQSDNLQTLIQLHK